MYNVACIKWGTKFTPEYVNRLFYGVRRNANVPFAFHCFTDNDAGIDSKIQTHPLPHKNVEGWWQKLYLFSDEIPIEGRVLFLDLDTLVVDNIDHFITHNKGFTVMRDLWRRGRDDVGSAVMSFEIGKHTHIWNTFIENPVAAVKSLHPHGDQKWIQRHQTERNYWQDKYPNQIVSFKSHCRQGVPSHARLICYHGKPSIIESITTTTRVQGFVIKPTPWVNKYWKDDE